MTADPAAPDALVERFYELAKRGEWPAVLAGWRTSPSFARECAQYLRPTSGWGFLHQAAFSGSRAAAVELVAWGADAGATSRAGETPADVARQHGHDGVATLVESAESSNLWEPPRTATLLPSSSRWGEARRRIATAPMTVGYAGSTVKIAAGDVYWADSFERVLVGWHGTYSPPRGMDGYPMVEAEDPAAGQGPQGPVG